MTLVSQGAIGLSDLRELCSESFFLKGRIMKCPGQDSRFWKPGDVFEMPCPKCGHPMEFFKDEPTLRCRKCRHKIVNPKMDFGCASYCKYADQCLGELPPELLAQRKELLKDRVAVEMKRYFRQDFKRIGHTTKVARYAERIAKAEKGDLAVVLCAAYLHDVGRKEAEQAAGEGGVIQDDACAKAAREILERLDASKELTDEVCSIIARLHHPLEKETCNFLAVQDGNSIACLEEKGKESSLNLQVLEGEIENTIITENGKKLARGILLPKEKS